jgi:hypothetical protein
MERTLLFKYHLSVNILAKYQLIIGIHIHPHQYLACYIFFGTKSLRHCPWCGGDADALGCGVLKPQTMLGAKA